MTFEEALDITMEAIHDLEEIEKDTSLERVVRNDALANRVAISIMVAWAKKAYEKNDACAMHILNAVHGV
ncbi:MAG: hypothetical protein IJ510_01685 [Selenomonadales bacterium]|nr:hypothetical protein [Selenomonadales bacterium]